MRSFHFDIGRRLLFLALLVLLSICACQPAKVDLSRPHETLTDSPSSADLTLDPLPLGDNVSQPARALVRVSDPSGHPIPNASVVIAGEGALTDGSGDASILHLAPEPSPVEIRADGFATTTRWLDLDPGGQHRLEVKLAPRAEEEEIDLSEDVEISADAASLAISPGALVAVDGTEATSDAAITWTRYSPQDATNGLFPGDLRAVDRDGKAVSLVPLVAFQLDARDATGLPLHVANGSRVWFSQLVPAGSFDGDCGCTSAWFFDPGAGLWVEAPDVPVSVVSAGGQIGIDAELPALGTWAFAQPVAMGCLDVEVSACAGLEGLPVDVRVEANGSAERRALTALMPNPVFKHLAPGEVSVSLLVNHQVVDVTTASVGSGGECAAVALDGPACSGLAVALSNSEDCPVEGGALRLTSDVGEVIAPTRVADALGLFPSVGPGDWTVEALDNTGVVIARGAAVVPAAGMGSLVLEMGATLPDAPPGGCAKAPCWGDHCDACLAVQILDDGATASVGTQVDVYDPLNEAKLTDGDGQACFDVPDGDRAEPIFYTAGQPGGAAALTAPGSCGDPGTCTVRTLWRGTGQPGWESIALQPALLGWREPGHGLDAVDPDDWDLGPGFLRLDLAGESALGDLPEAVRCEDGVIAARSMDDNPVGFSQAGGVEITCEDAAGVEVQVAMAWPDAAFAPGEVPYSAEDVAMTISLTPAGSDTPIVLTPTSGTLSVYQRGGGEVALDFDLDTTAGGADQVGIAVAGALSAPLLTAADAPRTGAGLEVWPLTGAYTQTDAISTGEIEQFGPSNAGSETFGGGVPIGGPVMNTQVPIWVPSNITGLPLGHHLRPSSPIVVDRPAGNKLWLNPSATPGALIPSQLLWMSRDLATFLYRANGVDPARMDTGGTVFATPARWDASAGTLIALDGFSSAVLTLADGTRIRATPLNDALRTCPATSATRFAFLGVPPTTPERPAALVLKDASGAIVPEYTQRLVPMAGYVTVIGADAVRRSP